MSKKKDRKKRRALEEQEETGEVETTEPTRSKKSVLSGKTVEVKKTYIRKLNLAIHGGAQYETLDLGTTLKVQEVPIEDREQAGMELYEAAKEMVDRDIEAYDFAMGANEEGEEPAPKRSKEKVKKDVSLPEKDELKDIADLINKLINAKDAEELKEVGEEIAERKEDMTKVQVEYLKNKYIQLLKKLSE